MKDQIEWITQLAPIRNAPEVPMISDGTWPTAWPKETDKVPGNLYSDVGAPPALSINNSNMGSRVCVARHGMAINVGFLDGHVQTVDLPSLWKLRWHRNWDLNKPQTGPTGYFADVSVMPAPTYG